MNDKYRILSIFTQLLLGKTLSKQQLMNQYQVSGATIQRDINEIMDFVAHFPFNQHDTIGEVIKNRGQYSLQRSFYLSELEVIAILKVLYATRALPNEELEHICSKLMHWVENQQIVRKFIANEANYYQGIPENQLFLYNLEMILEAIRTEQVIQFDYCKLGIAKTFVRQPKGILFADLYFFVLTSNHHAQDDSDFEQLHKFRLHNIKNLKLLGQQKRSNPSQKDKLEVGQLLNQTAQLPFLGNEIEIVIDFYHEISYVKDRFPQHQVLQKNPDGSTRIAIKANDGYGVKMWLLSQKDMLKIVKPKSIVQDYLSSLEKMAQMYGYHLTKEQE